MFKIIVLVTCLLAIASAGRAPPNSHPRYRFNYGVRDHRTGDNKSQWEQRDGDKVKGSYALQESDGTKRVVNYRSSKAVGFQAHVIREGHARHPKHGQSYANIRQRH